MSLRVIFAPEAEEQLANCTTAGVTSPDIAAQYTGAIVDYCESLCTFPYRGTPRDDIRLGLRMTNYRKRTVIAFDVDSEQVSIIGIFYGGRDYKTARHDN